MREFFMTLALGTLIAIAPAVATAGGNDCTFPGKGIGVGGTPGKNGSPGTFPGGGATGGEFPGGNCGGQPGGGGGGTVSASEPLSLALTAAGLIGAAMFRRRRAN